MTLEKNSNQQRPEDGNPNNTIAKNLANAIQGDEQNGNMILKRINNLSKIIENGDKKEIDLSGMNITDELLVHIINYILTKKIQVHHIVLNENQLTTLPASIGELNELQSLSLGSNKLTEVPEWIGELKKLKNLDLAYNQLTTLPESIGEFSSVQLKKGKIRETQYFYGVSP